MKLLPFTVIVNVEVPAVDDAGEMEFKMGTGLFTTVVSGEVKSTFTVVELNGITYLLQVFRLFL